MIIKYLVNLFYKRERERERERGNLKSVAILYYYMFERLIYVITITAWYIMIIGWHDSAIHNIAQIVLCKRNRRTSARNIFLLFKTKNKKKENKKVTPGISSQYAIDNDNWQWSRVIYMRLVYTLSVTQWPLCNSTFLIRRVATTDRWLQHAFKCITFL